MSEINTWSYQQNGNRGAQRYVLFGSESAADPGWNVEDRTKFTPLAEVDTRSLAVQRFLATGIRRSDGRPLGAFRWLAWVVYPVTGDRREYGLPGISDFRSGTPSMNRYVHQSHRLKIILALIACSSGQVSLAADSAGKLARPTPEQAAWQACEIGMFIHFAPNTWTDREGDDLTLPLEKMNPSELDTEQWVAAAEAMGAKYIVFVAKHVGGFCMWQTETTDYSVKSIPWRGGKGDVLGDLAASCRKRGMKLGVYLSPCDRKHGAGVGGRCGSPAEQQRYNELYRRQLTEVLTQYGEMFEVWFDGSNIVPVSDLLHKHAPERWCSRGPTPRSAGSATKAVWRRTPPGTPCR